MDTINIGTVSDDGTGDTIRDAFEKVNNNFTTLTGGTAIADSDASSIGAVNAKIDEILAVLRAAEIITT